MAILQVELRNLLIKLYKKIAYHQIQKTQAMKVLRTIESIKGKTSRHLIKKSNEYALEVLGWKGYAPWLYVYSAFSNNFRIGWIPDNYYGCVVIPIVKGDYATLSSRKSLTQQIFGAESSQDLMYFTNGIFYSKNLEVVESDNVKKELFSETNKVVFKIENSLQGRGVYVFSEAGFNATEIPVLGNGVFQKFINQHELFNSIVPNSVTTIRLTTVHEKTGHVSIRAAYLRAGRLTDDHVKSPSQVKIPIHKETGAFGHLAYMPDWKSIEKHPDTQFVFSGNIVPNFQTCRNIVTKLHSKVPQIMCIGWDLTVDNNNNVYVMEWNSGHNDIKFSEAVDGPCFTGLGWENLWRSTNKK